MKCYHCDGTGHIFYLGREQTCPICGGKGVTSGLVNTNINEKNREIIGAGVFGILLFGILYYISR